MGSRRWSAPSVEDTANVALFLASELGSFVTRLYIPVCGGQVMERDDRYASQRRDVTVWSMRINT